jgi:VWFA-related protein
MQRGWLTGVLWALLITAAFAQGQPAPPPGNPPANPPGQPSSPPPGSNPRQPQPNEPPEQGAQGEDHPENPYLKYATGVKARVTQIETGDFPTVRAYVAVTDEQGALIKTLKEGDFEVTENGTPVEGLRFAESSANLPLAIMFCVDVSGSMAPSIEQEKEAIRSFVAQLKPEDRVGLVTFSDAAVTQVSLTTDRREINRAVDMLVPEYQTALWDGVYVALQELITDIEPSRKALIVLSDGGDNRSVENLGTVMQTFDEQARQQNKGFSVFTLGLGDELDRQGLTTLADQTGGVFIESPTAADLSGVYETILSQIQGEYLLEYDSPIETQPGQIIDLSVDVLPVQESAPGEYTYRSPGLSKALARAIWPGLIAITVLTIVLLIATIFKLTRRAWLTVMITALDGREYTLKQNGSIGSSESADIRVGRDPALLGYHATLRETPDGFVLEATDPDAPIVVGERMLAKKLLRNGDRFILGTTGFTFRERIERPGEALLEAGGVAVEELAPLTVGQSGSVAAASSSRTAAKMPPPLNRSVPTTLSGLAGPYAGQKFTLKQGSNVIGRTEGDIVLGSDTQVSRRHCAIELSADGAIVADTGSTNGTQVNGVQLASNTPQPVNAGDTVQIGSSLFQLE